MIKFDSENMMNNKHWNWFYEHEIATGNIKLGDIPYLDAERVEYRCASMWTEATPDHIDENDNSWGSFHTSIGKNSTWSNIMLATQNLIERVKDCQHTPVSGFTYDEKRRTIRFSMDS